MIAPSKIQPSYGSFAQKPKLLSDGRLYLEYRKQGKIYLILETGQGKSIKVGLGKVVFETAQVTQINLSAGGIISKKDEVRVAPGVGPALPFAGELTFAFEFSQSDGGTVNIAEQLTGGLGPISLEISSDEGGGQIKIGYTAEAGVDSAFRVALREEGASWSVLNVSEAEVKGRGGPIAYGQIKGYGDLVRQMSFAQYIYYVNNRSPYAPSARSVIVP